MFTIKNKETSNLDKQYKRNCEAIQSLYKVLEVEKKKWTKYSNIIKGLKAQILKLSQENKELKAKRRLLIVFGSVT